MLDEKTESMFLDDTPCYKDSAFEIHDRIADAIVDEINNHSPSNIAILGEWGSGKSTVLNYVEAKLDTATVFFTFDAWAHSGDSLRRSFIESLLAAIVAIHDRDRSDKSKAAKQFDKLNLESQNITKEMCGTETKSATSERSSLKPIPASLLIAAGLFIFLNTFLTAAVPWAKGAAVAFGIIPADTSYGLTQFIPGLSFLLASITWYFVYRFINESYQKSLHEESKDSNEEICLKKRISLLCNELAGFFSKQIADTTTSTKTEYSSVLDSCTFERLFDRTLALTDKKVVIAFDNLDRLSNDEILSIWSTLQIFSNQNDRTGGEKKAWLILPITRALFAELEGLDRVKSGGGEGRSASLSKLFIRNFEIPVPISTEWKSYFFEQARIALPTIDDDTLAHVYAIASHSLLSMELRTPRNAKRFLNAMVAESKIFPYMDPKSIAAYCYLRDAYNMGGKEDSFINFMIRVINGDAPESFYLQSLENQSAGLKNDLAMMTFGQLTPEKASEVFVYAEVNGVIAHNKDIDISELVNDSFGSWETINRIIEDEIMGETGNYTPSWIFRLLKSLNPEVFSFNPSGSVMRNRLAQTLIGGIKEIKEEPFRGIGKTLAHYLRESKQDDVINITRALIQEAEILLEAMDEERGVGGSWNRALGFIREMHPILQTIFEYSEDARSTLLSLLKNINFGVLYDDLLNIAIEQNSQDYSGVWLANRPPSSLDEACGALRNIQPFVMAGDLEYGGISILQESGLPGIEDISSEEIDYLKEQLNISPETASDWKLSIWILENLCDLNSSSLSVLTDDVPFDTENYAEYSDEDSAPQKLAIVVLATGSDIDLDEDDGVNKSITRVFDSECIQLARERGLDLFSGLIGKSREPNSKKTAKWMLKEYWNENDSKMRDIEDCLAYAHIFNAPTDRRKLGRELGSFQRSDELMKKGFSIGYSSIYLGALEEDNENEEFKEWLIDGFKMLALSDWKRVLDGEASPNVFPLLEKVSSEKLAFPNLDKCVASIIETDSSVKYDICVLLDTYQPNFSEINGAITLKFFASKDNAKGVIKAYGSLMHKTNWIIGLPSSQGYEAIQSIIDSKTGFCLKWLTDDMDSRSNPKDLVRGHVRDVKKKLSHNVGLKVSKEYKNAARELKALLS